MFFRGLEFRRPNDYRPERLPVLRGVDRAGRLLSHAYSDEVEERATNLEPMTPCAIVAERGEGTYEGLKATFRAVYLTTASGTCAGIEVADRSHRLLAAA